MQLYYIRKQVKAKIQNTLPLVSEKKKANLKLTLGSVKKKSDHHRLFRVEWP